ncbi:class I SAM-dependent methyltransferase [Cohnella sp. LGH]|uniref:class I SAM-dependent methyltransferase n=1 Tax=Cohnella sp. LGH TaxID=1619153 RepID=UPI001ADC49CE|nr:class I SAM-dependent methyltransferase [Cohnella sp. LGH]QTH45803.1 class I SAM-dependent methyltransferase [Cohnella sp. LGH]
MRADFGKVASEYAKYRDRLPAILFEQLANKGFRFKDQDVIDLGSGSGIFSRDLNKHGARVIGIEPSDELIKEAVRIDQSLGINNISYVRAQAEDFTLSRTYPMFTAVRAWHWFQRINVIENIKRYLEPHGHLIVINSVFKPDSDIAQKTFEVLINNGIELKPAGSNAETKERRNGFPVNWFDEWQNHSFHVVGEWQQDYEGKYSHEEWCGKMRSVSWLTNIDESKRMKVTRELLNKLCDDHEILNVPHQFSIVILKYALQDKTER